MIYRAPQPRIRLSNNCQRRQRSAFNESGCTEQKFDELPGTFGVVAFRLSLGERTFVAGGGVRLAVFTAFRTLGKAPPGFSRYTNKPLQPQQPQQLLSRHNGQTDMTTWRQGTWPKDQDLCSLGLGCAGSPIASCPRRVISHLEVIWHLKLPRVEQDKIRLSNLFNSARHPWQ